MFRRRVWVAVSAILIIAELLCDPVSAGVLSSQEKNRRSIIGPEESRVVEEIGVKNYSSLTEEENLDIQRSKLELGSNQARRPIDTPRTKTDPQNYDIHEPKALRGRGANFDDGELPCSSTRLEKRQSNERGELLGAEKYAEDNWRVAKIGSKKFSVQRSKHDQDAANFDGKASSPKNLGSQSYGDDQKLNNLGENTSTRGIGKKLASTESGNRIKNKESGNGRTYLSAMEGGGKKFEDESSPDGVEGMVRDNDGNRGLGVSGKKIHPRERERKGKSVSPRKASGKARIANDYDDAKEPTTESFNDFGAEASLTTNVKSDSYGDSDNQRKAEGATYSKSTLRDEGEKKNKDKGGRTWPEATPLGEDSTRTRTKNDNYQIPPGTEDAEFAEGEDGLRRVADSREAIKSVENIKFNKKPPIGLSPANHRAAHIEREGRSHSNTERNPTRKYKTEESYRGADVAGDMRHAAVESETVANKLAYSDAEFNIAKISRSIVRGIGLTDDDEIGLESSRRGFDKSEYSATPDAASLVIQLESHRMGENSEPRLINNELLKTSPSEDEEIPIRGEISAEDKPNNILRRDETLSEIGGTISKGNTSDDKYNNNNNGNEGKSKASGNRDADFIGVIGGSDHVPRKSRGEIVAVNSSGKGNERPVIIETLNGGREGHPRPGEERISEGWGEGVRNEVTTRWNIRGAVTVGYSSRDNGERSEKHPDIQPLGYSSVGEVNGSELYGEWNISDENKGRDPGSTGTVFLKFFEDQQYPDLEITRPATTEISKSEENSSGDSRNLENFQSLVRNSESSVPDDDQIERNEGNEEVGKTTIYVTWKSSGNSFSDNREEGITESMCILRNSGVPEDGANENEDSSTPGKKMPKTYACDNTEDRINEFSEIDTEGGKTVGNREIEMNTTLDRTAMTGASGQNGLGVNLLAGKKNNGKLRDGINRDGVAWIIEKKKANLPDKFLPGKKALINLSTLDITGVRYPAERHFHANTKKNERDKLPGNIAPILGVVEGEETSSKLKQRREFSPKDPENNPQDKIQFPKFLVARLSDKYLASKTKRDMKSSGSKITKESTASVPPSLEDSASRAQNLSIKKASIAMNKSESRTVFSGQSEERSTPKDGDRSHQMLPGDVSMPRENSTATNLPGDNKGRLFNGDNAATKSSTDSYFRKYLTDINQTYSNYGSLDLPKVLAPMDSDLSDRRIPPLPENFGPTESPKKTTGSVTQTSLNLPFNFNQTNSNENGSRVPAGINQWPVKHSAVVEGDLVLGGLMMVHEREDSVTCGPVMPQGGVQALEAMLYTLDRLNEPPIIPGVKIGAHILDDCDNDTYGLEMAVDFIKGSISNIDGAEYHCNKTAVRKVISGVVGAASSVTSIQVANLLRLFRIPQVSFFSTSPELSNKQRFEYFTRTIPSDHYQVQAMVDIVRAMNWSYVSIIYEESNYGIKAFEELEELLAKCNICIAIKEKLVKDSGVAEETAYDNIVQKLLTKPRARGCIIFGSDQEVAGVMRAVRRCNATGAFSWIGSDGWSARSLVSDGNEAEVEGTLSVQPQANPVKGFEEYFLNLTVENNRRNPWFVEFWENHFECRYPNASSTPHNQKWTKLCDTRERLDKQKTVFEDQLQFVSDAVTAFAHAFRNMHEELCGKKYEGLCDAMKPTKGPELLRHLRKVEFEGLSGDEFKFDKNGDGPARYNIIHFKQDSPQKYKWVKVGEYIEGKLQLDMSAIQFRRGHATAPESVCSLPCEVGQAKKYVEGESCCWHCFNCTQYQIRDPADETQCIPCPQGRVPDETHSSCRDIPEEFLRPESGWAIGAMSFSATGILVTLFVGGVFLRHNDTPVVRASGRELSYVLLTGILLCYLVTFALVLRPNNIVCGIQRFGAGFCFTVVYAALLTKTNRISRIFNAGKQSAKRPSFISPRSQLIICSGLMGIQILINGVWMIIDPAKAMHHYPTREDNLLVCSSYIDASYMIAFSYPIILIVVCTVYAVLTRKIPEAFNESKHIGFTMYTTCVIWLAFVPLYFGTGNHVALRITSMSVTISLSASVTIACLFSPKLYIILIRPERNVRQSMMPARYNTTKSSAVTGTNASSMMAAVTLTAATCDQNKAVKRHVAPTIDCSTQSEHYEMEVKGDRINGKTPGNLISRSTQTQTQGQIMESESESDQRYLQSVVINTKDITSKEIIKDSNPTVQEKQANNLRIGNGPISQKDGPL